VVSTARYNDDRSTMESTPPRAEVTVYSPLFSPFRQPLQGDTVSFGRASDCSIPIKDRYLSRRHAEIVVVNGSWILKDLGSANGTYLNGTRVEHDLALKTGDRIRLGDTEIVFESSEHKTDRLVAIPDTAASATIAIPIHDIDKQLDTGDVSRLVTLNLLVHHRSGHEASQPVASGPRPAGTGREVVS
jgi:pSer/pThr/pTyr-binding forkhead associated (FHA) protein